LTLILSGSLIACKGRNANNSSDSTGAAGDSSGRMGTIIYNRLIIL